ncbi:MAG: guanylate kinase [Propionibacteriaceae bacterium]
MIDTSRVAVICGPTAVGKGTVVARLREVCPQVWVSVSMTTRAPRPGEIDGQHYSFVSDAQFDDLIAHDGLLEYAQVHCMAKYGTPRQAVMDALADGKFVILEIDIQGARQVKATWPHAKFIFIDPPSWTELERRLVGRGTETAQQQQRRLATAREEMDAAGEFQYRIVNEDVERTVAELITLCGLTKGSL